jgi:ribonuclease BN (tRNA processing enzyme)
MKLTFLGSGSAFTTGDNFHSNMLLESQSKRRLLIDCGSDARHAAAKLGLTYADINDVYISHLHADHAGGLEWLCFCTKFDPKCEKPRLFIHQDLVNPLWDHQLSGSLGALNRSEHATLSTYFDVVPLTDAFQWEGIRGELVRTHHIELESDWWTSYGLFLTIGSNKILITTDTQFSPDHFDRCYKEATIIFHECETSTYPSGVHSHYTQLKTLPANIKSKMWLYHYNPGPLPDAKADGFLGFVARGQEFDFAM